MNNLSQNFGTNREREREREREMSRSEIFSFQNLLKSYYHCRKNKRKSASASIFELNFEKELLKLEQELLNYIYRPSRSICFVITDPKLREVWAADFRDRILHHLLISRLEPIWEKMFIFHSYACRDKKGSHKAVKYLEKIIAKKPNIYFLQIDVRSFFVSINKNILFSIIKKHLKNPELLWLTDKIIFHNPASNYQIKGDARLLKLIPSHKSLFCSLPHKGLPIGNLTSQFFANVYLNELDQFIKHSMKCRHYFRYMDDMLLLDESKTHLITWREKIKIFLKEQLDLELHPKKQIFQPVKNGINFCGYIIKPGYMLIRRRTVKSLKNKLWRFNQKILERVSPGNAQKAGDIIFNNRFSIFSSPEMVSDFQHIFASINSTYGFFKHADCYNLRKSIYKKHFGILKIYLVPANENYDYFIWDWQ